MDELKGTLGSAPISTRELLLKLGFTEDQTVISDPPPGLSFDFGNFKLEASWGINRWFVPTVLLTGVMATERTISQVESGLLLEVESVEQGMALVAWCLDEAAGGRFEPIVAPTWLAEGRQHRHLLPWERKLVAYAARPHCYVQRDWVRVALKKLAEQLATVDDDAPAVFRFENGVLTIRCAGNVLAMPAEGDSWTHPYSIKAAALRQLPKRLMRDIVEVSVWDSALTIGNWRYNGASPVPYDLTH